jgi:hypothetical protein
VPDEVPMTRLFTTNLFFFFHEPCVENKVPSVSTMEYRSWAETAAPAGGFHRRYVCGDSELKKRAAAVSCRPMNFRGGRVSGIGNKPIDDPIIISGR